MMPILSFIRRLIGVHREFNETSRAFTKEVTQFQQNADRVQRLTINHDTEWFQNVKPKSNGECK